MSIFIDIHSVEKVTLTYCGSLSLKMSQTPSFYLMWVRFNLWVSLNVALKLLVFLLIFIELRYLGLNMNIIEHFLQVYRFLSLRIKGLLIFVIYLRIRIQITLLSKQNTSKLLVMLLIQQLKHNLHIGVINCGLFATQINSYINFQYNNEH